MSRISERLRSLKLQGKKALIPFITAGDPEPGFTLEMMMSMVDAGADIIELGVPFSDPMADGPVIQRASERALINHISLRDVFGIVREFRRVDQTTPVVLMGYLNPVEALGYDGFAELTSAVGVDGVLTVDLPIEEAAPFMTMLDKHQIDPIFLLAPTTTNERAKKICEHARGFLYYVSLKGVTGSAELDIGTVRARLAELSAMTDIPINVGFGISDAKSAAQLGQVADGVIVGSALVKKFEEHQGDYEKIQSEVTGLLGSMRKALDDI